MGRHSKQPASWFYRGKHRAPTQAGKQVARVTAVGVILSAPVTVGAGVANAAEFDHGAIIACESGGDARAQNPSSTASGLYQFINSTWKAYGGSTARAKDASVSEQRRVAERAFAAEGYGPWAASRSCWSGKIGSGTPVKVRNSEAPKVDRKVDRKVTPKAAAKSVQRAEKKRVEPVRVAPKVAPKTEKRAAKDQAGRGTHRVVSGDTLSGISLRHTGDASNWTRLHAENRDVVGGDPHLILPGQVLDVKVGG